MTDYPPRHLPRATRIPSLGQRRLPASRPPQLVRRNIRPNAVLRGLAYASKPDYPSAHILQVVAEQILANTADPATYEDRE